MTHGTAAALAAQPVAQLPAKPPRATLPSPPGSHGPASTRHHDGPAAPVPAVQALLSGSDPHRFTGPGRSAQPGTGGWALTREATASAGLACPARSSPGKGWSPLGLSSCWGCSWEYWEHLLHRDNAVNLWLPWWDALQRGVPCDGGSQRYGGPAIGNAL